MASSFRVRRPLAAIRAATLIAGAAALPSCDRTPPCNIVLVTVDTLRADHLGAWGSPRGATPAIDRFVTSGTSFPHAIVPRSQTWPTLASVLTGRYPVTHGVRKNGQRLDDGIETLAGVLAGRGYACGAFLANSGQARWPGFHALVDLRDRDDRVLVRAKKWLRRHEDRPFFLWLHLFAPHRPFQPPPPYDRLYDPAYAGPVDGSIDQMQAITGGEVGFGPRDLRHMIARYDGEIRYADRCLGELLGVIARRGLEDRTLVAFTADHGEELYERHGYFSHSASIYDTVLRAPLAFRWPGRIPAGRRVPGIVESIDVAPTLLALAGIPVPEEWEGHALDGVIDGCAAPDPARAAVSELENRILSLRTLEHRYVYNPDEFAFPMEAATDLVFPIEAEELYVHRVDPGERVNRAADRPARASALRERALEWMERHRWEEAGARHERTPVPDDVRESLEALGYVN